jgi:hypothetical protein
MIKRLIALLTILLFSLPNLMAEEFIAKRAIYEKDGSRIELKDLSGIPVFYADYYPSESIVKIKCSAGNLVLKKGIFFYGYSGKHKGLKVTARAYVEDGKLTQIVYEEVDELNNMKSTISYYRK